MDLRELAGPKALLIASTMEFSALFGIELEVVSEELRAPILEFTTPSAPGVLERRHLRELAGLDIVNEELRAPTLKFTTLLAPEGMDVRILAGPDVDITELLHMVLHACLGGWMWGNSKARR